MNNVSQYPYSQIYDKHLENEDYHAAFLVLKPALAENADLDEDGAGWMYSRLLSITAAGAPEQWDAILQDSKIPLTYRNALREEILEEKERWPVRD